MTKNKELLNERTIRRWGKLANIAPLTENFLDEEETLAEEEGEEDMADEAGEEMEMGADDAGGEEPSPAVEAQVEDIVAAVVDALAQETGVDIEMDAGGGDDDAEVEMDSDDDDDDAMMRDEDPMMRDKAAMMRDKDEEAAMRDPMMREESLDIEVIDDEQLTEAVLKRVVERLLKRNKSQFVKVN